LSQDLMLTLPKLLQTTKCLCFNDAVTARAYLFLGYNAVVEAFPFFYSSCFLGGLSEILPPRTN
jgi:hypothetical protein